jgi:TatD DNase family protein
MSFNYFDIHAHIHFPVFDVDRDEVIKRAHDLGVGIVNVGTQKDTSVGAIALAEKYSENMYAIVGLHPIHAGGAKYHDVQELSADEYTKIAETNAWDKEFYKNLAQNKKVVAIGECGLDYFRCDESSKEKQREIFIEQIHLANEVQKPLMLHVRGERRDDTAYAEALAILQKEANVRANFHFFAGSVDIAKQIWSAGYSTSLTGVITFTPDYNEVVREAPLENLMTETDCPYAAPVPYRGKRNEPSFVVEVVKKIAELRNEPLAQVAAQIAKNTQTFFGLS